MKNNIEQTIEERFEAAVQRANNARINKLVILSNEQLLELYGLFKQATKGDNKSDEPWLHQLKEKAKWNAWKSREGLTSNTAMRQYIKLVEKFKI